MPAPLYTVKESKIRLREVQAVKRLCEACNQNILGKIVIGIETDTYACTPICLCESCGLIDLDLMQFCREIVLGCNEN